jgi:erythromycin esterase-like protein
MVSPHNQFLILNESARTPEFLERRGHRAIGVVYNSDYEQFGNYVPTVLPDRYDALLFIDESHAVHPLHMPSITLPPVPETYPTGV